MSNETQLFIALGYCIFMFIFMKVLIKYTPKEPSHIYGYRTRRSLKNQDTWTEANSFANNFLMKISVWSFLLPPLSYFLFPQETVFITIVGNCFFIVLVLFFTEHHMSKIFDENGIRKQAQ